MNLQTLVRRGLTYHWRTNLAVALGVAAAVSVLAGALLVGDSVRGSLRDIALGRLGRTDTVVASTGFFRDTLAADLRGAASVSAAAPLIVASGFVTHERSGRRASKVLVYGVDGRFWEFHGLEDPDGVFVSPALAAELDAGDGDVLLTRVQRPSEIPVESLFGRKDDVGRTIRLTLAGTLSRERLGEFALQPQQTEVRAIFAPLGRIQRDLDVGGQVNTVILAGEEAGTRALRSALRLEDLGVRVTPIEGSRALVLESATGIVNEALESAAQRAGERLGARPVPVFTYLANTMRAGGRQVPYSLVTATDLALLPRSRRESPAAPTDAGNPIFLNDWAARELQASPGDPIDIEYYLWDPAGGLLTRNAAFTVAGIVPIEGLAADRRLAPEYPGITGSESLAEWDPPFPIDLSRVRPQDERYWEDYRTTPKAFIPYERGRDLWTSRYGGLTSMRFLLPEGSSVAGAARAFRADLGEMVAPQAMGVTISRARAMALEGSRGATDFGEYFTYFSFFLVVAALLLAVLFFRLGIEQRLRQIGTLRASGYSVAAVRRVLLGEAVVLATAGAGLGVLGAIAYAQLVVYGLRTWWIGAVGTTLLTVHVSLPSLAAGALGGIAAAIVCVLVSLRAVARHSPRALLAAQALDVADAVDPRRARRSRRAAVLLAAAGGMLLAVGFANRAAQAGAFFGAGAALLIAALMFLAAWLRARDARPIRGRGLWAISRLGFRSAASRPGRSVLSAALIAAAVFIIVSVDAFRRGGGELSADRRSGTGGYALLAESELPLLHDPNEPAGREELLIRAPELVRARFARFRVREGEDASCLNLYRPTNPTIVAPESSFIEEGRFAFVASLAGTEEERANPWLLLRRRFDDGAVPVIADATSLQYVLHLGVGDSLSMDIGAEEPLVLRFVASLSDSVLQREIIMSEEQFARLFPRQAGYRMFLIEDPGTRTREETAQLAGILERELRPFGIDAIATVDRLEEFHRVENTYLSTFQALGGLGLLLGTVGLATVMFRNVLERRRELAVLRAVGYDARNVSTMILAESAFLLGTGVAAGAGCALLAIAPAWLARGGTVPGAGLLLLLGAVVAGGLLSSLVAVRAASSGRMLDALRAE
ncbi:MAG TPA: FtsX-like permease family protein [Vicinamibacterales bacterium]|nr:FtsX-like permease family protein [Vicinamibacterales bacterium]